MVCKELRETWAEMEDRLKQAGLSRHGAHVKIARQFGYCTGTVYRALTPQRLTWEHTYSKRRQTHPRSPKGLARRQAYNTEYVRTVRKLPKYIGELLDGRHEFTLAGLREVISSESGITSSDVTLAKRVRRYIQQGCPHGHPVEEIEERPGRYRLKGYPSDL